MEIRAVKFRVGSEWRVGGLYRPDEARARGAVLMLHGFPGVQQNEDIAAELCRRGMTVFQPHFRGCWGSPGEFTVHGIFEDARVALRLLSRYHEVDPRHVGILGHSVGGWVALRLAAETPLAAVVVMAPAVPRADQPGDAGYLRKNAKVLNIPRVEEVWKEYLGAAGADRTDRDVRRISPTPLLFLQGFQDRVVSPRASAALYAAALPPKQWVELPDESHEFERDRPSVIRIVCRWLEARISEAAPEPAEVVASNVSEEFADFVDIGGGD